MALVNLQIDNLWESMLAYWITQKLPAQTRQQWEQLVSEQTQIPSYNSIVQFLENRFRALEALSDDKPKFKRIETRQSFHAEELLNCIVCNGNHNIRRCNIFESATHENRFNTVKRIGLCLNCLGKGHLVAQCPSNHSCTICKRRHHTLLHREGMGNSRFQQNIGDALFDSSTTSTGNTQTNTLNAITNTEVMLATALIQIETPNGGKGVFRALLDQGSQANFITENAVQYLRLKRNSVAVNIVGVGLANGTSNWKTQFTVRVPENNNLEIDAYVLKRIANPIPAQNYTTDNWKHLQNIALADPTFNIPGKIDFLFGADVYAKIILDGVRRGESGPIAQHTLLGWIVSGDVSSKNAHLVRSFSATLEVTDDPLSHQLERFWNIEEINCHRLPTKEEENCERFFKENTVRGNDGRYTTRLPFKNTSSGNKLGASRHTALASLTALERRFQRNPALRQQYQECIDEYVELGHMFKAKNNIDIKTNEHNHRTCVANYLPHHAVFKESSTTKVRVVFDASRKTDSGLSLNDVLMTGPSIQNEMAMILLQWRLKKYAFVADIEKMYRQIRIHKDDAEYQRILWRKNPSDDIEDFCLSTVTFGTTCAPFLAIRTLHQLAEDGATNFPLGSRSILDEFYVDDVLSGGSTYEETLDRKNEVTTLLNSAGFKLRKWIANSDTLLQDVPNEDLESNSPLDLNLDHGFKTLGINWHPKTDEFSYNITLRDVNAIITKRKILSDIAHLFDPLGWLAPVVIAAKIIMKSLWLEGADWDEPVSPKRCNQWHNFTLELQTLKSLRIPRWFQTSNEYENMELHGFSDASEDAYAAVIYLIVHATPSKTNLVIAKTKVAPVKTVSIPRLELCGALLLAKLMQKVRKSIKLKDVNIHLWTDSTTVLAWLKGNPSRWTVFVANRTTKVYEAVGNITWRYVPSKDNPADVASRGVTPKFVEGNQLWWNGPTWLTGPKENWPTIPRDKIESCDEELRKKAVISNLIVMPEDEEKERLLSRYSSLSRLIRVSAYCFRFIALLKDKRTVEPFLTTQELDNALIFWIKYIQQKAFAEEIDFIRNKKKLSKKSKILKLNPWLDDDGILRVGGRLQNAELSFDNKHPIIVPKQEPLTNLLIKKYHLITLHGGIQLTMNTIRSKYWIIDARRSISHFIQRCVICHKQRAKTCTQLMGNLPSPRVNPSRPFSNTGIDYCGPIEIRTGKGRGFRRTKGYVAVFICLTVKAIHLELVSDQSTQAFLAAFRRFVGRRGMCRNIYSDCGTNFVGANTELQKIAKRNQKSAEQLSNEGISWHFNPPASPHFGGLWEAGVKSLKYHLRRTAGNACLTYEELSTVLVRIEACLNSRPLCPLTDDPSDLNVLTPGHFLIGDALLAAPEDELSDENLSRLDRWQLIQRISQTFWKKWTTEYLARLQERPKWTTKCSNMLPGDLVLVKDERLPSYKWPIGRIEECHMGPDGLVRVVTVRTQKATYKRPIAKIALLPIDSAQTHS